MSIWGSRDGKSSAVERLHLSQIQDHATEEAAAQADPESADDSAPTEDVTTLTPATVDITGAQPHSMDSRPAPGPVEPMFREERRQDPAWDETQRIARCLVGLDDFRTTVQDTPPEEIARLLVERIDADIQTVGGYVTTRLGQGGPAGSPPADVQTALAMIQWLVVALESASGDTAERLTSIYPSLATIRSWEPAP